MLDTLGIEVVNVHPPVELATAVNMHNEPTTWSCATNAGTTLLAAAAEKLLALSDPILKTNDAAANQKDVGNPNETVFVEPDLSGIGILSTISGCIGSFRRILDQIRSSLSLPRRLLCTSF